MPTQQAEPGDASTHVPATTSQWSGQSINDRLQGLLPALTAIPVVLALGLVLLYTVGASLVIAQLVPGDIGVTDAITLIPLEQILARGIGTVIVGSILIPIVILGLQLSIQAER